jgi:apolipoprotein N-acyltransferase
VHTQEVLEREVSLADGTTLGVRLGFWVDLGLSLVALALMAVAGLGRRAGPGRMGR